MQGLQRIRIDCREGNGAHILANRSRVECRRSDHSGNVAFHSTRTGLGNALIATCLLYTSDAADE